MTIAALGAAAEPFLSFRTAADAEKMRVHAGGVSCEVLHASRFVGLVDDYVTVDRDVPPTAAALATLHRDLSNLVGGMVVQSGSGTVNIAQDLEVHSNLHVYGTAVIEGDTLLFSDLTALGEVALGCNLAVAGSLFTSNVETRSITGPDLELVATETMTLRSCNLWLSTQTVCLGPGSNNVVLRCTECNLGINLPVGTEPVCTLHVNGAVFASEELFALSDKSVKTDVQPVSNALDMVQGMHGCTYLRVDSCDAGSHKRHLGVIAQDVQKVCPEAVHSDANGKLSVAYGNLVAVAIEAVKELAQLRQTDLQLIRDMEQRVAMLEIALGRAVALHSVPMPSG
jgi:hypothetical protein